MSLVFVYTIPRPTANGMSQWVSNSGVSLKKTKVGRSKDRLSALYSPKVGGLANYISYTPWIEGGVTKTDSEGRALTLQDKLEQKWNLQKGYLTNRAWRKGDSMDEKDMTYFQRKSWSMEDGCTVLDLSKFDDEMHYYVLLASSLCANSEREWRAHKWPKALYYIALESESEDIQYQKSILKSAAFAALHSELVTPDVLKKLACLLQLSRTTSQVTEKMYHNLLFNFIESSTATPGSNIDKFNFFFNMLKTAKGKSEFEARYIIKQGIDTRVIYEKQNSYFWTNKGAVINIGDRIEEAVEFINSPKKAKEVEEILQQIKENS